MYGYDSEDEELYQPAEQKYYSFNGWTDENGLTVESISNIERGEANLYSVTALNAEAVEEDIKVEVVFGVQGSVSATMELPETFVAETLGNETISAIGFVLTNTQNAEYEITKENVGDLNAPSGSGNNFDGGKKEVKLSENAYAYAYGWANYYGTLTVKYNLTNDLGNRYFTPWVLVGEDTCNGAVKSVADSLQVYNGEALTINANGNTVL